MAARETSRRGAAGAGMSILRGKSPCVHTQINTQRKNQEPRRAAHAPKQIEESKGLDAHANEGPLAEDENNSAKETDGPAEFLFSREEIECLLWANDERQARDEKNLRARQGRVRGTCAYSSRGTHVSEREKRPIEEEHDTEEHEQHTERGQRNADF